jgi:glycosyltransferase involved in cell wall biosynthesis
MTKKIFILHEYGSNSHYRALKYLCNIRDVDVIYREFSITKSFIKSILKRDVKLFKKQFLNIIFLVSLIFSKNKKIILGVAPYDFRLVFLSFILKNHQLYYHTSWTSWDRSFYPKKLFVCEWLINFWEGFIRNRFIKIFVVSEVTQNELINYLKVDKNKIVVVNHSYDDNIYNYINRDFTNKFLYVGR